MAVVRIARAEAVVPLEAFDFLAVDDGNGVDTTQLSATPQAFRTLAALTMHCLGVPPEQAPRSGLERVTAQQSPVQAVVALKAALQADEHVGEDRSTHSTTAFSSCFWHNAEDAVSHTPATQGTRATRASIVRFIQVDRS